jgi:hypothetical protein
MSLYLFIKLWVRTNRKLVILRIVLGLAKQRMFTQPLFSIGWFIASDWLALNSLWVVPISPSRGDGCSALEASRETYVASGACSSCNGRWWCGMWRRALGCVGCKVEGGGGSATCLVQHIGRLNPIGWHGDGPAAHEDLHCFLSPWQDLVGAAVGVSNALRVVSCRRKTSVHFPGSLRSIYCGWFPHTR